ncbi:MAG: hypothetical protein AAF715_19670 [Myxococcota bacterium]
MSPTASPLESALLDLVARDVTLDVATVATQFRCPPDDAERALDALTRRGAVDLHLDEETGALTYRPRVRIDASATSPPRPTPPSARPAAPRPPASLLATSPPPVPPERRKHSVVGMLWALVVPGFGLGYAAPWSVALLSGFLVLTLGSLFGALPIVGPWLEPLVVAMSAIGSALASLLYVKRFNQVGARSHLHDDVGDRILSRLSSV